MFKLFNTPNHHFHTSLGFTAPTGDVAIKIKESDKNLDGNFLHYGMQLGSGTWDFKPSLTYTGQAADWSWGSQVVGTKRLESRNDSGYRLGDMFDASLWGGYQVLPWLTATVRATYNWQGGIEGQYPRERSNSNLVNSNCPKYIFTTWERFDERGEPIGAGVFDPVAYQNCVNRPLTQDLIRETDAQDRPSPMDFPQNYGGHYVDLGLGLSVNIPHGAFAGNRLSFEWLQPVYTNANGYQLDRDGALNFTWSYGF